MAREPLSEAIHLTVKTLKETFPTWSYQRIADHLHISHTSVMRILRPKREPKTRLEIGSALKQRMMRDLLGKQAAELREIRKMYEERWKAIQARHTKELADLRDSFPPKEFFRHKG